MVFTALVPSSQMQANPKYCSDGYTQPTRDLSLVARV